MQSSFQLILLDRDGVVNHESADFIKSPSEWRPLDGAIEAIVLLQAHFDVAICTNQSGVGRGLLSESTLQQIHDKLNNAIIDAGGKPVNIYYCPHTPDDDCSCRKPRPGLISAAIRSWGGAPKATLYAGDSARDLEAAQAAGCQSALLLTGNGPQTQLSDAARDVPCYRDLAELAEILTNPD